MESLNAGTNCSPHLFLGETLSGRVVPHHSMQLQPITTQRSNTYSQLACPLKYLQPITTQVQVAWWRSAKALDWCICPLRSGSNLPWSCQIWAWRTQLGPVEGLGGEDRVPGCLGVTRRGGTACAHHFGHWGAETIQCFLRSCCLRGYWIKRGTIGHQILRKRGKIGNKCKELWRTQNS